MLFFSDAPKTTCRLEAVRWVHTISHEEARDAVVRVVLFGWTPAAGREAARRRLQGQTELFQTSPSRKKEAQLSMPPGSM